MSKSPFSWFRASAADADEPGGDRRARHPRALRVGAVVTGIMLAAGAAFAATNWTVGLGSSKGQAQSPALANITMAASASPAAINLVYPGGYGDVVVTFTNTNKTIVTITQVSLPSATTYANAYTNSALTTTNASCTTSYVAWAYAANVNPHTLATSLIIGANSSLTVTFTNDATMGTSAASGCASSYFAMPSLTGITGTAGGTGTPTASPATDSWTS